MTSYDEDKFSREQQIGVFDVSIARWLQLLENSLSNGMKHHDAVMEPWDMKMAIYYLEGIVTEQQHMIRYLLARDNKPKRRWWKWGRKK